MPPDPRHLVTAYSNQITCCKNIHSAHVHSWAEWPSTTGCRICGSENCLVINLGLVNECIPYRLTFMINESAAWRLMAHRDPQFHFVTLYCWMQIDGFQWASAQFERLPRTWIGTQAVFACPLNQLYPHSANWHVERNWGSHHWNASLRATNSLMMTVCL